MDKIKGAIKRLFTINPNLTALMNKSRIFNTWLSVTEIIVIVFAIAIPARTNQS